MMLVLKEGRQVAFGTAKDMLEAVRRLQVVPMAAYGASDDYQAAHNNDNPDTPPDASPPAAAAVAPVGHQTQDAA
jgi:hypothetical protein